MISSSSDSRGVIYTCKPLNVLRVVFGGPVLRLLPVGGAKVTGSRSTSSPVSGPDVRQIDNGSGTLEGPSELTQECL